MVVGQGGGAVRRIDLGLAERSWSAEAGDILQHFFWYPYENLERLERKKIFDIFFNFAKRLPIEYKSFIFNKLEHKSKLSLVDVMTRRLIAFLKDNNCEFSKFDSIIVYYDNGQQEMVKVLQAAFISIYPYTDFRVVSQSQYRLLQVADQICTLEAINFKRQNNTFNKSEKDFFESMNKFQKNYMRALAHLKID